MPDLGGLTVRELWLMRKAWECSSDYYEMDAWLDDEVADGGITVAMVLDKDAPRPTEARDDGE